MCKRFSFSQTDSNKANNSINQCLCKMESIIVDLSLSKQPQIKRYHGSHKT